jgi:hypothetical protein
MERLNFPELIGDTSFERVRAIIRNRVGKDTHVEFKVFRHSPRARIPKIYQDTNTVHLHMDSKWNCVMKTPFFRGYLHNAKHYDDEDSRSSFTSETK